MPTHTRSRRATPHNRTAAAAIALGVVALSSLHVPGAHADTPAQSAETTLVDTTPTEIAGTTGYYPALGSNTPAVFRWGTGQDIRFDSAQLTSGITVTRAATDPIVTLQRAANDCTADLGRQTIWYASGSGTPDPANPSQYIISIDGSRVPDMATALTDPYISNGMDNLFENDPGVFTCNNIERMDYIHAPFTVRNATEDGYFMIERGSGDPFAMAAVTAVDGTGTPTALGTRLDRTSAGWGSLGITVRTPIILESASDAPRQTNEVTQNLVGRMISMSDLGIGVGDTVYGFVLAAAGVPADLLAWQEFPTEQAGPETGIDLAGAFLTTSRIRTIGDTVWLDLDADGVHDSEETGIPGVTVELHDTQGELIATATTDADGRYEFTATPAEYTVKVIAPDGYVVTYDEDSGTTSPDGTGVVGASDNDHPTADFGLMPPGSITLIKSLHNAPTDTNGDGVIGAGDMLAYTFSVTNSGPVTLTNITIIDPLVSVTGGPLSSLAVGATDSSTFTAEYTITDDDVLAGGVENTAIASATTPAGTTVTDVSDTGTAPNGTPVVDPGTTPTPNPLELATPTADPGDDPTTALLAATPLLTLSKAVNAPTFRVGDTLTYTLTATNNGNVTLENVEVTDSGIAGLTPLTCTPAAPATLPIGGTLTCTTTLTMTAAHAAAAPIANTATAHGTTRDGETVTAEDATAVASFDPTDVAGVIAETGNRVPLTMTGLGAALAIAMGALIAAASRRRHTLASRSR